MRFALQSALTPVPVFFSSYSMGHCPPVWAVAFLAFSAFSAAKACTLSPCSHVSACGSPPLLGAPPYAKVTRSRGPICNKLLRKDTGVVNMVNVAILLVILILPMLLTFWAIRDVA
jgi:hypothetical protein